MKYVTLQFALQWLCYTMLLDIKFDSRMKIKISSKKLNLHTVPGMSVK